MRSKRVSDYISEDEVNLLRWLRELVNRPVLAYEIRTKLLSHKEALELLIKITNELNGSE